MRSLAKSAAASCPARSAAASALSRSSYGLDIPSDTKRRIWPSFQGTSTASAKSSASRQSVSGRRGPAGDQDAAAPEAPRKRLHHLLQPLPPLAGVRYLVEAVKQQQAAAAP